MSRSVRPVICVTPPVLPVAAGTRPGGAAHGVSADGVAGYPVDVRRLLEKLRSFFRRDARPRSEGDAPLDPATATSRATGGAQDRDGSDATTTGPGQNETFVGRVSGQDEGYAGETGAERRSQQG